MNDQAERRSRPWRRFLRISVRGMILLVLVVGAALGGLVRQAQIQRDAVAAVKYTGGSVEYSWEQKNKLPKARGSWAPNWLVDLIGIDFFDRVTVAHVAVSLDRADTTLAEVGRLNHLESLFLTNAPVTDVGLVHLKGLTNLSFLSLNDTQVTDAGLVHL